MQQIYDKRNEIQKVEFFEDAKHTVPFDFMNAHSLDIHLVNGDITPLCKLHHLMPDSVDVKICVTGISYQDLIIFANFVAGVDELNNQAYGIHESEVQYYFLGIAEYAEFEKTYKFDNFHNITPNLSKYIPEDNAVLFLSKEDLKKYEKLFKHQYSYCNTYAVYQNNIARYDRVQQEEEVIIDYDYDKTPITEIQYSKPYPHKTILNDAQREKFNIITIYLPHGTESEIKKANEIAKELMEQYRVEEVNLCVLHCFVNIFTTAPSNSLRITNLDGNVILGKPFAEEIYFNKIITTNSTGILKPEDGNEHLQVIDCKEIFEDYLKENNL